MPTLSLSSPLYVILFATLVYLYLSLYFNPFQVFDNHVKELVYYTLAYLQMTEEQVHHNFILLSNLEFRCCFSIILQVFGFPKFQWSPWELVHFVCGKTNCTLCKITSALYIVVWTSFKLSSQGRLVHEYCRICMTLTSILWHYEWFDGFVAFIEEEVFVYEWVEESL